jgi:anti-anti-sigma regulatory factor
VTFIDSAGLGVIVEIAAAEAEDGRRPVVVGASTLVRDQLQASGVVELVILEP